MNEFKEQMAIIQLFKCDTKLFCFKHGIHLYAYMSHPQACL